MSNPGKDHFPSTLSKPLPAGSRRVALGQEGDVEKVMVMLSARQIHVLGKICLEICQTTGVKFKRSMLIRSIIDGFLETTPSYETAQSPADVKRIISQTMYLRSFPGSGSESSCPSTIVDCKKPLSVDFSVASS